MNTLSMAGIFLCAVLSVQLVVSEVVTYLPAHSVYPYHHSEIVSVLASKLREGRQEKLGISFLLTDRSRNIQKGLDRKSLLICSLRLLLKNLRPQTPFDIIVFVPPSKVSEILIEVSHISSTIVVQEIPNYAWLPPSELHPVTGLFAGELKSDFTRDYRQMGHFRLTFILPVFRQLGYKYAMFIDDDAFMLRALNFNLLHNLTESGTAIAGAFIANEPPSVIQGLAELARYYIVTEGHVPTRLYDNCYPKNITGVYTPVIHGGSGWNGQIVMTNFVAIKLDFWFSKKVQAFVGLCVRTGGHYRFRWEDQAVVGMVFNLFVSAKEFIQFDFVAHTISTIPACRDPALYNSTF